MSVMRNGLALTASLACPLGVFGQVLSIAQLHEEVAISRSGVIDLEVDFTFAAAEALQLGLIADHRLVLISGDRLWMEREYLLGDGGEPRSFFTGTSIDGQVGWGYQQINRRAYTQATGDLPLIDTEGSGFFDLMMWYPCSQIRGQGPHGMDLLSILASPQARVREQLEELNGSPCHVVDVVNPSTAQIGVSIWLDGARGFLPVLQHHDVNDGGLLELEMIETIETAADVWLPVRGERRWSGGPTQPDATTYSMVVATDAHGLAHAYTNQGLPDDRFDYSTSLPPGTLISNLDTGAFWVATGDDYRSMARAAIASVPTVRATGASAAAPASPPTMLPLRNPWWIGLVVTCCLVSMSTLLARRRV
jgi:hypothetical protein